MMNGIVAIFVVVLLGAAAELASRWWIHHRTHYYVFLPRLRMRLSPDRDIFPRMERSVRFDVNAEGERGDEVPAERTGLFRVLVAGGSQPEGYLLDQKTFWPGRSKCSRDPGSRTRWTRLGCTSGASRGQASALKR